MAWYRDHSPSNDIESDIYKVIYYLENIEFETDSEVSECIDRIEIMKRIKNEVDELRKWGNEMYDEKSSFESEVDFLKAQIEDQHSSHPF